MPNEYQSLAGGGGGGLGSGLHSGNMLLHTPHMRFTPSLSHPIFFMVGGGIHSAHLPTNHLTQSEAAQTTFQFSSPPNPIRMIDCPCEWALIETLPYNPLPSRVASWAEDMDDYLPSPLLFTTPYHFFVPFQDGVGGHSRHMHVHEFPPHYPCQSPTSL